MSKKFMASTRRTLFSFLAAVSVSKSQYFRNGVAAFYVRPSERRTKTEMTYAPFQFGIVCVE